MRAKHRQAHGSAHKTFWQVIFMSSFDPAHTPQQPKADKPVTTPATPADGWAAAASLSVNLLSTIPYWDLQPQQLKMAVYSLGTFALVSLYNIGRQRAPATKASIHVLLPAAFSFACAAAQTTAQDPEAFKAIGIVHAFSAYASLHMINKIARSFMRPTGKGGRNYKPSDYRPGRRI
jgi:hypothetical protein